MEVPWVLLVIGFGVKGRCVASPWMKSLNQQKFPGDIWKRWKAKGVQMVTEPATKPFGRTFTAKDPEGHFVTIYGEQ